MEKKRERDREGGGGGGRGKWVCCWPPVLLLCVITINYGCFTFYKETWRNIMTNLRSYTVKCTWIWQDRHIWPQLFNTWIMLSTASLISIQWKVLLSPILIYWIVIYLVDSTIFCSGGVNTLNPLHFCSQLFFVCATCESEPLASKLHWQQ